MNEISPKLRDLLSSLNGLPLAAFRIGEHNSLLLTFGINDPYDSIKKRKAISLGTYFADWKIFNPGESLLLSRSHSPTVPDIDLGAYEDIQMSNGKVRLHLSLGHYVEFSDRNMDDELFHVFLPGHVFVCYDAKSGWLYGSSEGPWTGGEPI